MIPVTKPFLPPKADYQKYIYGICERNWLTINQPLVNKSYYHLILGNSDLILEKVTIFYPCN